MNRKIKRVKEGILGRKVTFILIFFGYIILNSILNETYVTLPMILGTFSVFSVSYVLVNLIIVPFLIATTIVLAIDKVKDLREVSAGKKSVPIIAMAATLLGGACPGCFAGLFPAFIGLFGSALTLSSLPFYGLEIQVASSILLIISINYLTRDTICKIEKKQPDESQKGKKTQKVFKIKYLNKK